MTSTTNTKRLRRKRRQVRIRSKVKGTTLRPRFSVFKSNKHVNIQIIDDDAGRTLLSGTTKKMTGKSEIEKAETLGKKIAAEAKAKKIKKVVFDRGGYIYTGKIAAIAKGAREGGLEF